MNPNQLGRSPFPAHASQWMLVGLRGGAVVTPPFDPSTIAGLKMWLKADALPVVTSGTTVTVWNDSSSNGYNLTNSGTPTYRTNVVNGLPVVRFAGADAMIGAGNLGVPQPNTVFVVGKQTSKLDTCYFYSSDVPQIMGLGTDGTLALYAGGTGLTDAIDHSGAFHVFTGVFPGAGSGFQGFAFVDGVQTIPPGAAIGGNNVGTVGLMAPTGGTTLGIGDIAEVLIYNSALSPTDRGNVQTYLKTKYATP